MRDHKPIAWKQYRSGEEQKKIIKEEIEKMLKDGIIRKLRELWASPVVIVEKKDGSKRFCLDFRKLNNITKTNAHSLPKIDDLLEKFRKAKWFSNIDLANRYW